MDKRLIIFSTLVLLIIGGMIAGLFAGSIQKGLTIPGMPGLSTTKPLQKQPDKPAQQPSATANANMPVQIPANLLGKDTFQRNNQSLWGMASDGRPWGGDANTNKQVFSITGAAGKISPAPQGQNTFNALLGQPNSNTEVVLSGMTTHFDGKTNIGATVRWNDDNNWYKAFIDGANLTVVKHVNGTPTILKNVAFNAQDNVPYMLRFRAYGAMLFAKAWSRDAVEPNNWMIIVGDNTFTTGQQGLRVLVQTDSSVSITSFTASVATMANNSL